MIIPLSKRDRHGTLDRLARATIQEVQGYAEKLGRTTGSLLRQWEQSSRAQAEGAIRRLQDGFRCEAFSVRSPEEQEAWWREGVAGVVNRHRINRKACQLYFGRGRAQ